MSNFILKLNRIIKKNNSLVCVGLDSDSGKIPRHLKKLSHPLFEFNKWIINATGSLVCSYKLNTAFYESIGLKGIEDLKLTCNYLRTEFPEIPVIIDAKRGDIGNTNTEYGKFVFDYLKGDAITVHPYLGEEAIRPFLDRKDKGIIVLCRTSNPGAGEFQDLKVNGLPLYRKIAENVINKWNRNGNCLLVIGATYPNELAEMRKIAPAMTFLVPGIGAQGGDLEKTLKAGLTKNKTGLIINSSRAIIYSDNPGQETSRLKEAINRFRK